MRVSLEWQIENHNSRFISRTMIDGTRVLKARGCEGFRQALEPRNSQSSRDPGITRYSIGVVSSEVNDSGRGTTFGGGGHLGHRSVARLQERGPLSRS
jgi:hypothetical protein